MSFGTIDAIPVGFGNHHLVVVLQGGHQAHAQHFEEGVGDSKIPVDIEVAELLDFGGVRGEQRHASDDFEVLDFVVVDTAFDDKTEAGR